MFNSKTIILSFAIALATSSRVLTQNAVATALKDILSPTNTDKALQLIQLAAKRANKMPEIVKILGCNEQFLPAGCKIGREMPIYANDLQTRVIDANNLPVRVINCNELPIRGIYELPTCTICGNEARACGKDLPGCTKCGNKVPGCIICGKNLPARTIYANEMPVQRKPEVPIKMNLPKSCPCEENDLNQAKKLIQSNLMDSLLLPKEIIVPFPPVQEVVTEVGGCSCLMNPFLPAASPVSAKSSCFPPPTQSRGRFLRKIPIPPPTL